MININVAFRHFLMEDSCLFSLNEKKNRYHFPYATLIDVIEKLLSSQANRSDATIEKFAGGGEKFG